MIWQTFRGRVALAFLAAGFLPVVLGGLLSQLAAGSALRGQAIRQHRMVLGGLVTGTSLFVRERLGRLEALAASPEVQSREPARLDGVAGGLLPEQSFFEALTLLATDGGRLWGTGRPGEAVPGEVSRAAAAVAASGTAASVAAPPAADGDRVLHLLVPVFAFADQERIEAVLAARARLGGADLQDILDTFSLPGDDYLCILDGAGGIVARRGAGIPAAAERFVLATATREAAQVGVWTGEFANGPRTDLLSVSFSPVLAHWVAIGTPAAEAFALSRVLREQALAIGFLSLVLCAVGGLLLARSVAGPVAELTEGLGRVSAGEFAHRVDLPGGDEIGQAGAALNSLAEGLQQKMAVGSIWERFRRQGPGDPPAQS